MAEAQVRELLGNPSIIHENSRGPGSRTFHYPEGVVTLRDGRVTETFP